MIMIDTMGFYEVMHTEKWDFSVDTIIRETNLARHLILRCNTYAALNYLRKNISRAPVY